MLTREICFHQVTDVIFIAKKFRSKFHLHRSASHAVLDAESLQILDRVCGRGVGTQIQEMNSSGVQAGPAVEGSHTGDGAAQRAVKGNVRAFELLEMLGNDDTESASESDASSWSELCAILYTFEFFQNFDIPDVIVLAKLCRCVVTQKGHTIFVQGDSEDDRIHFILQGTIGLYIHETASKEQLAANAESWEQHYCGREGPCTGLDIQQNFGEEVRKDGPGSILGENVLLDARLQLHYHIGTGPHV